MNPTTKSLNSIHFSKCNCCPLDKHSINLSYRKLGFCVASFGCVYRPSSWWPQHSLCVIGVKEGLSQILACRRPGRLSASFSFLRANLFARNAWSQFVCLAKGSAVCMSLQDGWEKWKEGFHFWMNTLTKLASGIPCGYNTTAVMHIKRSWKLRFTLGQLCLGDIEQIFLKDSGSPITLPVHRGVIKLFILQRTKFLNSKHVGGKMTSSVQRLDTFFLTVSKTIHFTTWWWRTTPTQKKLGWYISKLKLKLKTIICK